MGGTAGNDLWGWADPDTGREYALMGLDNGTAFVDVTEPETPVFLGRLPTRTFPSAWRDIKVYRNHAYIVADGAGAHGMQVFDLTRLRGLAGPQTFSPDRMYLEFASAHNIAINEDSGFAYALGTNRCGGGLHMIDIRTPNNPMFAGCHGPPYTHDTQCVTYRGPDPQFVGREICFSANETHVAIVDVSIKASPVTLAEIDYPELGYVHQGWLTEDHRYFFLGDEFDELHFGVPTRTHVFDFAELTAPQYLYAYEAATRSPTTTCISSAIASSRPTTPRACGCLNSVISVPPRSRRSPTSTPIRRATRSSSAGPGASTPTCPRAPSVQRRPERAVRPDAPVAGKRTPRGIASPGRHTRRGRG
jgi:choice-of-anchor B domain-containing protein